jgi:hypothetical protein
MVNVEYWVPEDGDTEAQTNIWKMDGQVGDFTVGDIKRKFPLPGSYYFRESPPPSKWFNI